MQVDGLNMIILKLRLSSLKLCSLLWSTERNWWRNCLLFQTPCGSACQYITQTLRLGMEVFGTIMIMLKTLENPDSKCECRKTARSRITTSITVKMLSSAQTAVTGLLPNQRLHLKQAFKALRKCKSISHPRTTRNERNILITEQSKSCHHT